MTSRISFAAAVALCLAPGAALADDGNIFSFFSETPRVAQSAIQAPARETPETTREIVADPTGEAPGSVTIDTASRYLYLSLGDGRALRYGVGVGREGFEWGGVARVGRKAEWPSWTPPAEMLKRRPDLPRHMEGGLDNPLGARALYLYSGQRDLMYRIHGTNEPDTIGEAVSSGCIRMLNADVEDLYPRVPVGAKVVVIRTREQGAT
jgi:lipoprotein-anchoring transpeptidase ErfK/SrfK